MKERRSRPGLFIGVIFVCLLGAWIYPGPGGAWLDGLLSGFADKLGAVASWYQSKFDGSARLIAPIITILSGTYALVKTYKYAEARLHHRLHEFILREDARLREARSKMRMLADQPGVKREFVAPVFLDNHLKRAVRELGWGSYFLPPQMGLVEYQLESAIAQIESQTTLSVQRHRHLELQLATAHLLRGALLVATASNSNDQGDRLVLTNAASHFSAALETNPEDEEALEYLAQVQIRLGQTEEASAVLDKVLQLTAKQEKSLARSRALRSKARIAEAAGNNRVAVRYLRRALEVLPHLFGDDRIEEAEINEAIADCQMRLEFGNQARSYWQIAQVLYGAIATNEADERHRLVTAKLQ